MPSVLVTGPANSSPAVATIISTHKGMARLSGLDKNREVEPLNVVLTGLDVA